MHMDPCFECDSLWVKSEGSRGRLNEDAWCAPISSKEAMMGDIDWVWVSLEDTVKIVGGTPWGMAGTGGVPVW